MRRRSEKCVAEGSKYAHWTELYLSFHLSWVWDPFIHGRLQNLKTREDTSGHDITPLSVILLTYLQCGICSTQYLISELVSALPVDGRLSGLRCV